MINKLLLSAAIVLSGATTIEAAQKKSAKVEKQLAAQCDAASCFSTFADFFCAASIVVAPLRTIAADNNSLLIIFKVLYR